MQYSFHVQEPYKTYLLNWQKTIEWRLNKWKYASLKVWDTLSFESGETFEVKNLTYHKNFSEIMWMFWKEKIIPDARSDKEALNVYYNFFTPEEEKNFWVVAIHLQRKTKNIALIHGYGNARINPKVFLKYKKCLENYISNNPFDIIISSGWFTDKNIHESEAEAIKNAIIDNINFDWERILEERSFTTFENIEYCAEILKQIKDKEITVFCRNTHLPKIVYLSLQKYLNYQKKDTLKTIQKALKDKKLLEFDWEITFELDNIKFVWFDLWAEKNKYWKAIWSGIIETHYDEFQDLHDNFVKIRKEYWGIK